MIDELRDEPQAIHPIAQLNTQWIPHSFFVSSSHHHRPARSGSPGTTGRVHAVDPYAGHRTRQRLGVSIRAPL